MNLMLPPSGARSMTRVPSQHGTKRGKPNQNNTMHRIHSNYTTKQEGANPDIHNELLRLNPRCSLQRLKVVLLVGGVLVNDEQIVAQRRNDKPEVELPVDIHLRQDTPVALTREHRYRKKHTFHNVPRM
jgi:hypothetical protein